MNCPDCKSPDTAAEAIDGLGYVHTCVECEATWVSDDGATAKPDTLATGADRRAMQRELDRVRTVFDEDSD